MQPARPRSKTKSKKANRAKPGAFLPGDSDSPPLQEAECRGGLLFGYFFLARQEKVTRRERRNLYSPPRKALRQALRYTPPRWKTLRGFPPYGSHPPEGGVGCCPPGRAVKANRAKPGPFLPGDSDSPPLQEAERRRCAGDARHGRRARNEGAGTPLRDVPPEQRRSEGSLVA